MASVCVGALRTTPLAARPSWQRLSCAWRMSHQTMALRPMDALQLHSQSRSFSHSAGPQQVLLPARPCWLRLPCTLCLWQVNSETCETLHLRKCRTAAAAYPVPSAWPVGMQLPRTISCLPLQSLGDLRHAQSRPQTSQVLKLVDLRIGWLSALVLCRGSGMVLPAEHHGSKLVDVQATRCSLQGDQGLACTWHKPALRGASGPAGLHQDVALLLCWPATLLLRSVASRALAVALLVCGDRKCLCQSHAES